MMKKIVGPFSFILSLVLLHSAQGAIRIVTDIDDTIKITNVSDPLDAAWNVAFTSRAFTGTAELYRSMTLKNPDMKIYYLSAASEIFRPRAQRFLKANEFPQGEIELHQIFDSDSIANYKLAALERLIERYPDDQWILIGDDTQADPHVYFSIFMKYPGRIADIYIRRIQNRRLPSGIYSFVTAFDIAKSEYAFRRLDLDQVEKIAATILDETREKRILPRFQSCPEKRQDQDESRIEELAKKIDERIAEICAQRTVEIN